MVEAGGVGIFEGLENTQVIEESTSSKRQRIRIRIQLERIWNAHLF